MSETSIAKLEKERDQLIQEMKQRSLLAETEREQEARLWNLDEELELRTRHYQELLDGLRVEQTRVLEQVLPRRYHLHIHLVLSAIQPNGISPERRIKPNKRITVW